MENNTSEISTECQLLLARIKTSNIQAFFPKTQTAVDRQDRLHSLSLQRRKFYQDMHRQHSLTASQLQSFSNQKLERIHSKPEALRELYPSQKPQINFRKTPKNFGNNNPVRQPFANLANTHKFRLTLNKQKNKQNRSLPKIKPSVQNTLRVNGLVTKEDINSKYTKKQDHENSPSKQKHVHFSPSIQPQDDSDNAVQNASKVNEIFNFIKEKAQAEGQEIDEFTQIIFKLVCFFFVSFITQKGTKINFDPHKMIDFIEKQISQSYSALNSFKKSRKQGYSNQNLKSSEESFGQNSGTGFVRKSNRVSSFFKGVQHVQAETQKYDSKLESLRKYNMAMSANEDTISVPYAANNNLKIPSNGGGRRLSIALNSVKQDNDEQTQNSQTQRTVTERSNNTNTFTIGLSNEDFIEKSNERLPRLNYRASMTRRKSCFMTEMNKADLQKLISQGEVVHANESQSSNVKLNSNGRSSNHSGSDLQTDSQLKSVVSYLGLSNSQINSSLKSGKLKSKVNLKPRDSKTNLNLSTPYDFTKEDNLMTKRRKYLELHQQITKMTDQIDELKKEEDQITERIEVKDGELIALENKLMDINQEIQMFESRTKQAEDFLNSNDCPQLVQKLIKKNQEIKKNLTTLLNSHAWQSSNLSPSSNAQHIYATKQATIDKLNNLTRKFRGCKNLENIEPLVGEMRDIFLYSIERYSEIIEEFQDKLGRSEEERSSMLKNLQDWEIENKIKEKLLNNSFLDYYSVERKVTSYIEKLPDSLKRLQQSVFALSHQRKAEESHRPISSHSNDDSMSSMTESRAMDKAESRKILMMEKEIVTFLDKMLTENTAIFGELPKQKKYAMVLQKIV